MIDNDLLNISKCISWFIIGIIDTIICYSGIQ